MKNLITADEIVNIIQKTIVDWHIENETRPADYQVVTDAIRRIKPLNEHRNDLAEVVKDLALANIEIWHQEDVARTNRDEDVVRAKRNIDPLNQHRNDLMEEIDEIILEKVQQ